jgi:ATP-binding cassette subfamily B protein
VVLNDVSFHIPHKKTTAIVGTSGSGKTTLLKLLLKFYDPVKGEIYVGDTNLSNINASSWRKKCGVVMQDGYLFTDSIAKNIALGVTEIDRRRLREAVRIANIHEFIESLPLNYNTKIGAEGYGLSQGQKQRILIARAIYKDPEYIFFDEATNSLDANNEAIIINNLNSFLMGKTAIIVAHRLSTVKNADNIIVIENARLTEQGTHRELCDLKGSYYNLIKNQLELGS